MPVLVFAADALVRFRAGRILIHNTASPHPAWSSDQPMLVGWLCQFARPTDVDAQLAALNADSRRAARAAVDELVRAGALVAPGDAQAEAPSVDERYARSRQHLRLLARSAYELACDVMGLGPHAESELAARTGVGLERRLLAMLASVDGLRHALAALRGDWVAKQLQALGVDPAARGLKLHIGCGPGHLEGWVNIDVHPAPLAMNVQWGLPFADRSVERVFVSHLLEHLYFPNDATKFLGELKRVLAPGGQVRIVVPDVEQCIEAYASRDASFFASRRETWEWWPENPTRLEDFLAYAGAGPDPGYLFEAHKFGYDFETLGKLLADCGFTHVRRSEFMASDDPALRVDSVSSVAGARYGERYYSLFVEASA